MSILTDHTAQTAAPEGGFDLLASREYVPPRANLLPPEIAERLALKRLTAAMVAAVVLCGGVVAAGYFSQVGGKAPAQDALSVAQAQNSKLMAQQAKLAPSQTAHAQVLAAKKSLEAAMGSEVLWSNQMNVLRGNLPAGLRLSALTVTAADPSAAGSGAALTLPAAPAGSSSGAASSTTAIASSSAIATVSMSGVAVSNYVVADWLDVLARINGWSDVYLASVSSAATQAGLYTFSITANINSNAFSHRYTNGG